MGLPAAWLRSTCIPTSGLPVAGLPAVRLPCTRLFWPTSELPSTGLFLAARLWRSAATAPRNTDAGDHPVAAIEPQ
jgi:hypothetical protein